MVDSVVFVIETKIVDSSAPNSNFYGNKLILEALCTIRLAIQVKIDDEAILCQIQHIMYVGFYVILALCRCYSWNILFLPLQFSLNHTLFTFQLISHSLDCIRYLFPVCDLRHFKATVFAHFGNPSLAQSVLFWI